MTVVLFVHGTGGRKTAYDQTFAIISEALRANKIALEPRECLWGDTQGSADPIRCLPAVAATATRVDADDHQRWRDLATDPFIEVRLIAGGAVDAPAPGGIAKARAAADATADKMFGYVLGGDSAATLAGWGLKTLWPLAWTMFCEEEALVRSAFAARHGAGEPGRACARALTALLLLLAAEEGRAVPTRPQRNAFIPVLAADMGVLTAGVKDTLTGFFQNAAFKFGTRKFAQRRGPLSQSHGAVAGDILLYQARGAGIRAFIKERVEEARSDVVLLAHSLGGVACVDLLAQDRSLTAVKGLITVGSQAPLFAEFGALVSLDPGITELRTDFPKWLNIYDESDFLSYLAKPIFGEKAIEDFAVDSGQPFPLSHGAYWTNSQTWEAVKRFHP